MPHVWAESRIFKGKDSKTVGKHLPVWVEHKLFKGKSSKMTGNCLQFGLNISFIDEKDPKQREAFTKLVRIPAFQE